MKLKKMFQTCQDDHCTSGQKERVFSIKRRIIFQNILLIAFLLTCLCIPAAVSAEGECAAVAMYGHHAWETQYDHTVYPTCTTNGSIHEICTACPAERWIPIPATGHNYVATGSKSPATCESDGWQEMQCTECGDTFYSALAPLGHNWVDTYKGVRATCVSNGYRIYRCTRCGLEKTETEYATGIHFYNVISESMGDCQTPGYKIFECSVCGDQFTEDLGYAEHDYEEYALLKGDCMTPGYRHFQCSVCGDQYTEELGYGDHSFSSWKITTPATDHSAGTRTRTCSVCGKTESETFDPDGTHRRGDTGSEIASYQSMLIDLGYLQDTADGVYGGNTQGAVTAFQAAGGLAQDGIMWPQTKNAIKAAWEKKKAGTGEVPDDQMEPQPLSEHPAGEYAPVCTFWAEDTGIEYITVCTEHGPLSDAITEAALKDEITLETINNMLVQWEASLDALYEKWAAITVHKDVVESARKAFYLAMDRQGEVLAGNDASTIAGWRLQCIRNEVFRLCALLNAGSDTI